MGVCGVMNFEHRRKQARERFEQNNIQDCRVVNIILGREFETSAKTAGGSVTFGAFDGTYHKHIGEQSTASSITWNACEPVSKRLAGSRPWQGVIYNVLNKQRPVLPPPKIFIFVLNTPPQLASFPERRRTSIPVLPKAEKARS